MSRQEAHQEYHEALKAGQKNYHNCVLRGRYPYLQVLDEILDDRMVAGRVNLGILEIPTDQIVGTKTEGRKNAFASNFMPLFPEHTEFSSKWINLCEAHLSDEGIHDPIRCYEYLGRFYVQEGNKRVSVLKHFGASTIPGHVIRLVPVWSQDDEIQRYYEFLEFYQQSRLYCVSFTQHGGYSKLQAALGYEHDHVWTEDERLSFLSSFTRFQSVFDKLGGKSLPVTAADALLVWLKVYSFESLKTTQDAELTKSLSAVWADVKVLSQETPISVQTAPEEKSEEKHIFNRLVSSMFHNHLNVAFINEWDPTLSTWTQAHVQGARYLEEVMGNKVTIQIYNGVETGVWAEDMMEWAISQGAQVIFTTTPPLISACRKIAARHPEVKILNCSVSMPYTGVRTYYSRIYEGKFISGAIAGAMSKHDELGYVASYPIFGVPAGINAFALGAQLTNPRAKVKLMWSCLPGDPIGDLALQGIDYISSLDITSPDHLQNNRGLSQVLPNGELNLLASPYWNWGVFYVKIVSSIMNGSWDALNASKGGSKQAVNYWWGMSSGVIGLQLSPDLPEGVRSLVQILQKGISDGSIEPFRRRIRTQDGTLRNDGRHWFTPEDILNMDWLCDTVDGSIPSFEQLNPRSQPMVRLQGIYRDQIPPEKGGVLL